MLALKRKTGSEAEADRTNEIVLVLPDGRRCRLIVRGRGLGEVGVVIDAPRDVVIVRGELDREGRR